VRKEVISKMRIQLCRMEWLKNDENATHFRTATVTGKYDNGISHRRRDADVRLFSI